MNEEKKGCVCVHVGVCVSRKVRVHGAARGVNRPQTGATVNLRWATCLLQQPVTSPWPHWELYNWLRNCNVLTQLIPGISFFTKAQDEPRLSETHIIADEELQLRKSFMIPVCFQTHLHSGSICTHARQRSPIRKRCQVLSRRSACAVDSTCFCFVFLFFSRRFDEVNRSWWAGLSACSAWPVRVPLLPPLLMCFVY